jgi:hypothetical protein
MNKPAQKRTPGQGNSDNQANRNRNRKRSNNNRRRRPSGPKLSPIDKAYRGYLVLLEKHLDARRKYYDLFHRADPRQLAKLERNFYNGLKELRDYEEKVDDEVKEDFIKKIDGLKPDRDYSTNHNLDPAEQLVPPNPEEEPHYLATQRESFAEDTEESSGSIEDYYSYKGIEPPEVESAND